MRKIVNAFSGRWWRFDHYILEGFFIRPAAHAKLEEYDLWGVYEDSLGKTNTPTVHHELLSIGEMHREYTRDRRYRQYRKVAAPLRAALLQFVTQWGLLGIALERMRAIHYAVKPDRSERLSHQTMRGKWHSLGQTGRGGHRWAGGAVAHIGGVEPLPALDGGAVVWNDPFDGYTVSPIKDLLRRYMPSMIDHPADTLLPLPCSEAWWRVYAEPWYEVAIFAANLSSYWTSINRQRATKAEQLDWWLAGLNNYGGRWTPQVFSHDGQEITQRWTLRSLQGAVAEMCIQDAMKGRSTRRCANSSCGTVFGSGNARARFCTDKCQNTARRRSRTHKVG